VVIAIPNAFEAGQATEQARKQNPKVLIVARAHSDEEIGHLKALGANVVIMGEREIGLGMIDVINRDSKAVAEITAADAVEAVLKPLAAAGAAKLPSDPNLLAEAIEAAQARVQHADTGPAEPPAVVASYGEEPDAAPVEAENEFIEDFITEATDIGDLAALDGEPELPAELQAPVEPEARAEVPAAGPRPLTPATTAGSPFTAKPEAPQATTAFNPEVPPPTAEEEKA
jgi:CPA2 family monovalent cation:H+ antiporter-2